MKIRQGFVSNSSTSSFIIYGAWIDKEDILKLLSEEEIEWVTEDRDMLDEVAKSLPLYFHYDPYIEQCAFGRPYVDIKDNERGAQFKKSVQDKLKKLFSKTIECKYISHTYSS